jgi:hypothetical protein
MVMAVRVEVGTAKGALYRSGARLRLILRVRVLRGSPAFDMIRSLVENDRRFKRYGSF